MDENQKQVLDSFQDHLQNNFAIYCKKHQVKNSLENLVTYMIDRQFLSPTTIRRYTIIQEFDRLYPDHQFHKSRTVETLADRFQLSTRHIWSLIKYSQRPEQRKKL